MVNLPPRQGGFGQPPPSASSQPAYDTTATPAVPPKPPPAQARAAGSAPAAAAPAGETKQPPSDAWSKPAAPAAEKPKRSAFVDVDEEEAASTSGTNGGAGAFFREAEVSRLW
jgi:hypothetical protein